MRKLGIFGAACVLALALAVPAFGGHIDLGVTQPPPPPSPASATNGTETGDLSGHIETGLGTDNFLTGATLTLLQSVLTVL